MKTRRFQNSAVVKIFGSALKPPYFQQSPIYPIQHYIPIIFLLQHLLLFTSRNKYQIKNNLELRIIFCESLERLSFHLSIHKCACCVNNVINFLIKRMIKSVQFSVITQYFDWYLNCTCWYINFKTIVVSTAYTIIRQFGYYFICVVSRLT